MTSIAKWNTPGTLTTILTPNSLSTLTMSSASSTYDNTSNLDLYFEIELVLAFGSAPATGGTFNLYIMEALDGTNFPSPTDADLRSSATMLALAIPIGVATSQRISASGPQSGGLRLPPTKFQFKIDNQASVGTSASGNTVKLLPYSMNLNG
jgi:hypothetical protein